MQEDVGPLGDEIVSMCRGMGFALAGVCPAEPSSRARELVAWLEAGRHGTMGWMEQRLEERLDPAAMLPGARSMILVADLYETRREAPAQKPRTPRLGRIARYARGDDYHTVIKKRLHTLCDALRERHPDEQFRAFTDTAPVLEREHASRAGLGWIGKHTLLIHPRLGSYMLLGGALTTLDIDPPAEQQPVQDHCGACTRCIDACPTDAITPYSVDASRCISYLTIEHRERIDPEFHEPIGDWLFGCDICQEVCPHNSPRHAPGPWDAVGANPAYTPRREGFDVLEVLGWSEDDRRAAFTKSSMKRAKLEMMKRNALIVAGNILRERADPDLLAAIQRIANDELEPDQVRAAAIDVLDSRRGLNAEEHGGTRRKRESEEESERG
ncbi:MAG: tRNA epoxyqueuosine(34) reductase QueG [Phycisphaeraceae bacterium]|nr:MAG: tRNA epoxyqueuosine(34) reductase QueG [Phycisphaeraceae bacterium]